MSKFVVLKAVVCENSQSKDFSNACKEWYIEDYYCKQPHDEIQYDCVCGQCNLTHIYTIRNSVTNNQLTPVGSNCVKRFNDSEMDADLKMFEKKTKIFKNDGKAYDGKTYDEMVKQFSHYIRWLMDNAKVKKKTYLELIDYYQFIRRKQANQILL